MMHCCVIYNSSIKKLGFSNEAIAYYYKVFIVSELKLVKKSFMYLVFRPWIHAMRYQTLFVTIKRRVVY